MPDKYTLQKPAYELTVRDLFFHFPAGTVSGVEEATDIRLPVVKSITVTPNESNTTIYASGAAYDVMSTVRDTELGLNAVAMPPEVVNMALGSPSKGAVAYDVAHPQKPEFGCGYYCENSDGSYTYYYHPRCKLLQTGNREHRTSDNQDPDPSEQYSLRVMATDEDVWRVRYFTAKHGEGKKALTPDEFFALYPSTIADILAIPEKEQDAGE